jgi:hypothetical protein
MQHPRLPDPSKYPREKTIFRQTEAIQLDDGSNSRAQQADHSRAQTERTERTDR